MLEYTECTRLNSSFKIMKFEKYGQSMESDFVSMLQRVEWNKRAGCTKKPVNFDKNEEFGVMMLNLKI